MKTIGLFAKSAGTVVNLRTSNVSASVVTYVVFVQAWTDTGKKPIASWHPTQLESAAGATLVLEGYRGYDLILKALIKDDASLDAELKFDGTSEFNGTVNLPGAEGPVVVREWSIVIV
jgi:hypothetical protein